MLTLCFALCSMPALAYYAQNYDRPISAAQQYFHLPLYFTVTLTPCTHIPPQEMLYSQMASTKTKEESDVLSDTISKCSLCLLPKDVTIPPSLSLDGREEEYHLPLLFHQGQSYHATCANFWCNAVLEELPAP